MFKYLIPKTIDEACSIFAKSPNNSIYIAGGTDVLLRIKNKKILPKYVISLKHIIGFDKIYFDSKTGILSIGALVTHKELENSLLIKKEYAILHDAVYNIGSVQIRNVATIGGNLVNAVPSADGAIPLIAMGAFVKIHGIKGDRSIKIEKFFVNSRKTVLEPGEILTEILIPKIDKFTSGAFVKFGRRNSMELPIINVGVMLSLEHDYSICRKIRIGLGVAAPIPIRAREAEKFLKGKCITKNVLSVAGKISAKESKVRDTIRGKSWHRKELISVFVERMGVLAMHRIKSSIL